LPPRLLAARRGQAIQDDEKKQSQATELFQVLGHLDDKAAQGMLSDREIEAVREKYDRSPEWAASMHSRNREGQQQLAKHLAQADEDRQADHLATDGTAFQIEAFGREKVSKAADRLLRQAAASGDTNSVKRLAIAMARNSTPWPGMKSLLDSINTADSKQATQLAEVYETLLSVSSDYAHQLVGTTAKAKYDRYLRETRYWGADPAQAWAKVQAAEAVDPSILSKQVADVWRRREKDIPTDFDDSHWYNPVTRDTKIQNLSLVKSEVLRTMTELMAEGQYADEPSAVFDAAWEKFKGSHVRVGNQYVSTFGTTEHVEPQTAKAMTDYSVSFKNQLVREGRLGEDDELWFRPDPNTPGKWTAYESIGGEPFPISRPGGGVEQVNPNLIRRHHDTWSAQEDRKKAVYEQAFNQGGLAGLFSPHDRDAVNKKLDELMDADTVPHASWHATNLDGKSFEISREQQADYQKLKGVKEVVNDPQYAPQDFIDFIHSNTR
ncbi:hypothetical protein, partial [Frateuria defendens]|uniref:hypothetical protein n=1 Tax=Frateuria defendens TaxID=2219559 RepID=UPI00066FEDCE